MGRVMRVVRSVIYGYLGAILGGVLVAVVGLSMGLSEASIVAVSMPTGIVFGALGLTMLWWRPLAARSLVRARTGGENQARR